MNTENFLEIEYKYNIPESKYLVHDDLCRNYLYSTIRYTDHYFIKSHLEILRIREDIKGLELTYKKIIGHRNIIREEVNIKADSHTELKEVYKFYEVLGYKFNFMNFNEALIIQTETSLVCLNKVESEGFATRYFLEVESKKADIESLNKTDQEIRTLYGLKEQDREYHSMFEIYQR